ncbi:MAG TPA: hypothetical protein VKT20_04550 [Candidatus Dormibacteraeota bacterium]|nr:hypothetical protein [Candidatus Dormibacteraeota bacterium]
MGKPPLRESDLRSLERERMYTIFAPLDVNEPLPRELLLAARRHRTVGRWELAGAIWLPALVAIITLASWGRLPGAVVPAAAGLTLAGLVAYAVAGDRRARRK